MVKPAGPGVYSATYSNIPVYEFQFGEGLKEHVMRRRSDDWINATHILKAAGFDKPARTRILEREVQKEMHEKVQGGYGKYQGTWVPLEQGEALAQRNNVYDKLRTIFEFIPGNVSPPPAPKHTTNKPKVPKKPAVPKWESMAAPVRSSENYDNISAQLNDDESVADDITVASASFIDEDDRYDLSQPSTGHRKRKREDHLHNALEQAHVVYSDELLDYFMLSHESNGGHPPEPPLNFQPDWNIDQDGHTAMHWAAAMGDIDIMKQLKRFGATLAAQNVRGETPLMRAVLFTNCQDKQTMPAVVKELIETIAAVDFCHATALHHAAAVTSSRQKHQTARYYLDVILNKMQEVFDPDHVQRVLDARDVNGNTAIHIAASNKARKCVRALVGRGASTDIINNDNLTAEDLIRELNENRNLERQPAASSSPYAPDFQRTFSFQGAADDHGRHVVGHHSEAAMSVESKITPLMLEKFQDLARSFDDELGDKIDSEKEARRILNATHLELNTIREQITGLEMTEHHPEVDEKNNTQLARVEQVVTSLIEQQQQLQLLSRIQHEAVKVNGHLKQNEDDLSDRIMLAKMLDEERQSREDLVAQYREALSIAGAGEKGEQYRRLISKSVGADFETMDANVDCLIEQLMDDQGGIEGETKEADPL